jgi:hypothetical protein
MASRQSERSEFMASTIPSGVRQGAVAALVFLGLAHNAVAADAPPASEEFRARLIKENTAACVKGIEAKPDLRAIYSHKTVETYCICRQRYRADVFAHANKNDERGQAVADRAHDYAHGRCVHILLKNLERE